MQREDWEQAIARAVIERAFRARLLADPAGTLADYGLSWSESEVVERLRPQTLEQLAVHLLRLSASRWERYAA